MTKEYIFTDEDADLSTLRERTIAIIGYGNQGRAQALNMKESGIEDVIVGNIEDQSWEQAEEDGFTVYPITEAAEKADIIFYLIPDEVQPEVYESDIEPNLEEGDVLNFASGYNITYDLIEPPKYVDVIMIAPRMIGSMVRQLYKEGDGAPSFLAIDQDYSGNAKDIALALGKGIGSTRSGVIEIDSFALETKSDLLMEQGLFPLLMNTMVAKYELEVEEGMPPEAALLELYLSKEIAYIFEEMAKQGIMEQMPLHSQTSQYGQLSRMDEIFEGESEEVDYEAIKEFMGRQLRNIDNGKFAREWSTEQKMGYPALTRLFEKYENSEMIREEQKAIEQLGLGKKGD
ncbi:ketol-acid reductoisomerase [Candidatus Bipolaricaulota bacterium]|nr:ketol-acid reductoisomerase [Candidatus Bipolaricaulota bacterium]